MGSRRWVLAMCAAAATAFACNAIIGVEDVKLKGGPALASRTRARRRDANVADDEDDIIRVDGDGPPEEERTALALGLTHTCARLTNGTVRAGGQLLRSARRLHRDLRRRRAQPAR